jgi:hypothetical protein
MSNTKNLCIYFIATAILFGAALVANPTQSVNAQNGNGTQNGNATNATVIITANSVDIDPLVKALKKQYPAIEQHSGDEDKSLAEKVKELKDAKETAKTIVAANLLRDLIALKALQEGD